MNNSNDAKTQEIELETFQKHVAERFSDVSSSSGDDDFLSIKWVRNILEIFVDIQEEFRILLYNNKSYLSRPPMDRLINEFYDRSVKALDVCNAIRDGIEQLRQCEKLIEIVISVLDDEKALGEGQIRRAKKCLVELFIGLLDEKETNIAVSHRNRSFGRSADSGGSGSGKGVKNYGHFRSLSWSVSRSWSASRQLQAMAYNLNAPRGNDVMASNGVAVAVYTMSNVVLLVMWLLVAAIPCQDRGLQVHFSVPRQYVWAGGVVGVYERVLEESKKKDRKSGCGLMYEIWRVEKWTRRMNELLDTLQFPLSEEKENEVRERVEELKVVFKALKDGLYPLEKLVREVFHGIVRSRTEGLDSIARGSGSV